MLNFDMHVFSIKVDIMYIYIVLDIPNYQMVCNRIRSKFNTNTLNIHPNTDFDGNEILRCENPFLNFVF